MPGAENGFFPPVDYSGWWVALAVAIIAVIIAFFVLVPLLTRARERQPEPVDTSWIPAPVSIREKYVELIGEVEQSHRRGELTIRGAHQRLSMLLRFFAYESSGIDAPQMTLADLRETRATPLSDAVARLYPGAFREVERGSVDEASDMARRVVQSWN